jgi:glutamate N-acetyltransferase / amino-acid N-acetyltransferase
VGREHIADGRLQAIVVNSKNANVATGPDGIEDARRMCRAIGAALKIDERLVLPSSTGVIGRPLPIARIEAACRETRDELREGPEALERFARAIMTTDTHPKWVSRRIGNATLSGVAKGSGMIEPNMATMLSYFFTDAAIDAATLRGVLGRVVNRSFNRVSVDSDTSTSDTVVVLANGEAGPVPAAAFESAFSDAGIELAKSIARDGEGASKLVEITVCEAASPEAALTIAKAVVNSPLVKTAIHGADPNWGRFVMAVGKVFAHPVPLERLRIEFATPGAPLAIAAGRLEDDTLRRIADYLRGDTVRIRIALGSGAHAETVWGCDLSADYVRINADYTT